MFIFLLVCIMLTPLTMAVIGALWKNHAPKNINWAYGYRTSLSTKNKETWDFAHKHIGKTWFYVGCVMAVITIIITFVVKNHSNFEDIIIVMLFLQMAVMVLSIIPTEMALHKNFNKDGSKKNAK